jgi:hypothetical protein
MCAFYKQAEDQRGDDESCDCEDHGTIQGAANRNDPSLGSPMRKIIMIQSPTNPAVAKEICCGLWQGARAALHTACPIAIKTGQY